MELKRVSKLVELAYFWLSEEAIPGGHSVRGCGTFFLRLYPGGEHSVLQSSFCCLYCIVTDP